MTLDASMSAETNSRCLEGPRAMEKRTLGLCKRIRMKCAKVTEECNLRWRHRQWSEGRWHVSKVFNHVVRVFIICGKKKFATRAKFFVTWLNYFARKQSFRHVIKFILHESKVLITWSKEFVTWSKLLSEMQRLFLSNGVPHTSETETRSREMNC